MTEENTPRSAKAGIVLFLGKRLHQRRAFHIPTAPAAAATLGQNPTPKGASSATAQPLPSGSSFDWKRLPSLQQIAFVDTDSGELGEQRLLHREEEEAEKFYRDLAAQGIKVRVGMEASGHARWFERLLAELNFELWIGDAAEISAKRVRKQKTDRQDAQLILKLMLKDDFPQIWVPSGENRDLRQLLWHRHRMVQARTRIMNQLQAVALNEGLRCKKKLWRDAGREQLEAFQLAP
jgi:transposase